MTLLHEIVETGPLQVNCQLLGTKESGQAVVIDPGGDARMILARLARHGLKLAVILATHGHFDHIGAVAELQQATGAPFRIHAADQFLVAMASHHAASWGIPFGPAPRVDGTFDDGEAIAVAGVTLMVIHTPGHTPGGVCFRWENQLAVGDTLFAGSIGRTDLPGGDYGQLITSVRKRLLTLPDEVACHPGHGPSTTVGRERRSNPFFS